MRIELNWGGGSFDILLDLATGRLYDYSSSVAAMVVHAAFGGKNYYTSKTALSGAGWIPGNLALVKVPGYRVDTVSPWINLEALSAGPKIAGWQFLVPFSYGGGIEAGESWPIIATRDGQGYIFLTEWEVASALRGQVTDLVERSRHARLIRRLGAEPEEIEMKFWTTSPEARWNNMHRTLEAINHPALQFEWPEETGPSQNPFWSRLGLHPLPDGRVYKITNNVCRASYSREELVTVTGLQAAAPKNVRLLTPNVYLQGQFGSGFTAVGLFCFDGEEVDYEISLYDDETRVVRAFGRDFADIVAELEAGARRKAEQDRLNRLSREEREHEEAENIRSLNQLATENGEVVVTFADSLAAGNCEPGTRSFRDVAFPRREEVKLAELIPHLGNGNVKRVVEWKLRQLIVGGQKVGKTVANHNGDTAKTLWVLRHQEEVLGPYREGDTFPTFVQSDRIFLHLADGTLLEKEGGAPVDPSEDGPATWRFKGYSD